MAENMKRDSKGRFVKKDNASWFKNAAKSLGYAGLEYLKSTMPATMNTIDVNKEFVVDLSKTLRRNASNKKIGNLKDQLSGKALDIYNDTEMLLRNAKSDLKSGKFYNRDRENQMADAFGLEDFDDFDFDFDVSDDLDDSNFDSDSGSPDVVVPKVNITTNINSDNPMVKAVEQQTRVLANNEMANSKRDIQIAETQMNLDKKLTDVLYGGIETVNSNLSILVNFNNEQVGGYIGASLKYYEENIRYMADISDTLKKIGGFVESQNRYEQKDPLENIIDGEGAFNLSGYISVVKKQLANAIDENMVLGSIKSVLESEDGIKAFAGSPLELIIQPIVNKMVPEFLTSTLKTFDDSFKEFIPAFDGTGVVKK